MKRVYWAFVLLFPSGAWANYSCTGNVSYFGIDGGVHVNIGYGIHKICMLNDEVKGDTCKAWMAMTMSAQAQDRKITIFYTNSTGKVSSPETCRAIGSWVTPSDPVYFLRLI